MKTSTIQESTRAKAELLAALSSSQPTNRIYVVDKQGNEFLCFGLFDAIKPKTVGPNHEYN